MVDDEEDVGDDDDTDTEDERERDDIVARECAFDAFFDREADRVDPEGDVEVIRKGPLVFLFNAMIDETCPATEFVSFTIFSAKPLTYLGFLRQSRNANRSPVEAGVVKGARSLSSCESSFKVCRLDFGVGGKCDLVLTFVRRG